MKKFIEFILLTLLVFSVLVGFLAILVFPGVLGFMWIGPVGGFLGAALSAASIISLAVIAHD